MLEFWPPPSNSHSVGQERTNKHSIKRKMENVDKEKSLKNRIKGERSERKSATS
jgi:hypothetical protein